eukprot:SAG11_NODE_1010_length_6199_cov_2.572131_4_plen_146_part_00
MILLLSADIFCDGDGHQHPALSCSRLNDHDGGESILELLLEELTARGYVWDGTASGRGKFHMTTVGMNNLETLKAASSESQRGYENMDQHDRWFGIWRWPCAAPSESGRGGVAQPRPVRRVDIVVVPTEQVSRNTKPAHTTPRFF